MTLRALIAGYYGAGNAGDEEILHSLLHSIRNRDPEADFRVISYDPSRTLHEHAVTAVGWNDLEAQVDAVDWSSLVIVGGGGLFQDYWGFDRRTFLNGRGEGISAYGAPILLAQMLGVPSAVLGVGIGPLHSSESQQAVGEVVRLAKYVSVRDLASQALLTACGVDASRIDVGGDLALLSPHREACISPSGDEGATHPLVGVAVRHWSIGLEQEEWEREVALALDSYVKVTGGSVLFVPFQEGTGELHDDRGVAHSICSRMEQAGSAKILGRGIGFLGKGRALGRCDLVLGMRLHSLIAAIREVVPAVGLAYDPKIAAFMGEGGMGAFCLPLRGVRAGALSALLTSALDKADDLRLLSTRYRDRMTTRAEESVEKALSLVDGRDSGPKMGLVGEVLFSQTRELRERAEQLHSTQLELSGIRQQRDYLLADRHRMEYDLTALRSSLGVKLIRRYWLFLGRLAPEGSRRRVAYRLFHPFLRAGLNVVSRPLGRDYAGDATLQSEGSWEGSATGAPGKIGPEFTDARFALDQFGAQAVSRHPAISSIVIFSATQMIESEGQRPTNLALEFAKEGIPVVFCGWRWDTSPWTMQDRIAEGILQFPMDLAVHGPGELLRKAFERPGVVIFEFPHPDFFHVAATAHASGWVTVYDVIDDWEGFRQVRQAPWYQQQFEQHLAVTSDLVLVVNEALGRKMVSFGRPEVALVPNGHPTQIGRVRQHRVLPRGELTIGYFGHLSSSWFDWDLILRAASERPKWLWHVIGYGADRKLTDLPANVILMGKVKQDDLASYADNWDVGLIPFRKGRLASGSDAIKLYEYLAMGLPVVSVGAPVPAAAEGLALEASDGPELIRVIEAAAASKERLREERLAFAARSTWGGRSEDILALLTSRSQRIGEKLLMFDGDS